MTPLEAYGWVVKKWRYIVKNDGDDTGLFIKYPKLYFLDAGCSYCEKYVCCECPLFSEKTRGCGNKTHPWGKWENNPNKANAQVVLDLVIKTKPGSKK